MKTFKKSVLTALAIMICAGLPAAEDPAARSNGSSAKSVRYFKFPSLLQPAHSFESPRAVKVEVLYTTDESGRVNFVLAKTENAQLKKEIEKQFSALSLENAQENVVHKMTLSFRII